MHPLRFAPWLAAVPLASAFVLAVPQPADESPSPAADRALVRQLNRAFADVAEEVGPSVVVIRVAHTTPQLTLEEETAPFLDQLPDELRRWFERRRKPQRKEDEEDSGSSREPVFDGQGSGVIIRKDGFILTNRHVVDGADKILVRFKDGSEFTAEVRGVDAQSDVAVIKIDAQGKSLPVPRFADSDKVRVGEFAIAIGTPFELDHSVTFGHVSAKGRSQVLSSLASVNFDQDFIQTDANINPGNSGGPLVNIEGEVIGINTLIRGMNTGIGFAIPSNLAREIADEIVAEGKFVRGYLGVRINALRADPDLRQTITNIQDGVVVTAILSDGPAAKSALKAGDVITAVEGRPVTSAQQLRNEIRGKKIGSVITLNVHRLDGTGRGADVKVKVKPQAWPTPATPVAARKTPQREIKSPSLGLTVESVSQELAEQHGVEKTDGVMVTEVEKGSPAWNKKMRPGDIITEVNHKPVHNPKEFREALEAADLKKGVFLNFLSRGTSKFEVLRDSGD